MQNMELYKTILEGVDKFTPIDSEFAEDGEKIRGKKIPELDELIRAYMYNMRIYVSLTNRNSVSFDYGSNCIIRPHVKKFVSYGIYYFIMLHELAHSTAQPCYMGRKLTENPIDSDAEEIVAEIAAFKFMESFGFQPPQEFAISYMIYFAQGLHERLGQEEFEQKILWCIEEADKIVEYMIRVLE